MSNKSRNTPVFLEKTLDLSLIFNILDLANQLKINGDKICQQYGVTTQQWLILLHLAHDPNIPYFEREDHSLPVLASELAASLNVTRPNVTNLIQILSQKELVEQITDQADARRKRLILTEKGWEIVREIQPIRIKTNEWLFENFGNDQKKDVLNFLQRCLMKITQAK